MAAEEEEEEAAAAAVVEAAAAVGTPACVSLAPLLKLSVGSLRTFI
ncbi:MAG: hypothetical protein ACO3FQ_03805 [Terrimicrobiaceae bacterium]